MQDHRHSWSFFGRGHANATQMHKDSGAHLRNLKSYDGCRQVQGSVAKPIEDLDLEIVALLSAIIRVKLQKQSDRIPPCFP